MTFGSTEVLLWKSGQWVSLRWWDFLHPQWLMSRGSMYRNPGLLPGVRRAICFCKIFPKTHRFLWDCGRYNVSCIPLNPCLVNGKCDDLRSFPFVCMNIENYIYCIVYIYISKNRHVLHVFMVRMFVHPTRVCCLCNEATLQQDAAPMSSYQMRLHANCLRISTVAGA